MNNGKDEYRTKDLGEASAIFSQGIKTLHLEKDRTGFYWFVFPNKESFKIADLYWSQELQVDAKTYYDAMRNLKVRLFQNVQKENY